MAKTKAEAVDAAQLTPESVDAALSADGFVTLSDGTPEPGAEGDWVPLAPGVEINGTLERAFFVTQPGDAPRVAYAIRDVEETTLNVGDVPSRHLWLVGEKAELKKLRSLHYGAQVRLTVKDKEEIGKNREIWRFKIEAREVRDGKGRVQGRSVLTDLMTQHKALDTTPF